MVDFLVIPVVFYIIVAAAQLNLGVLREEGWLFNIKNGEKESWYKFYSYLGETCIQFCVTEAYCDILQILELSNTDHFWQLCQLSLLCKSYFERFYAVVANIFHVQALLQYSAPAIECASTMYASMLQYCIRH
jgi:hypothetical protein